MAINMLSNWWLCIGAFLIATGHQPLKLIKGLFARGPKMAYIFRCKNCETQFSGKRKFSIPKNICPNCEAGSLFVPSDISIGERVKMYRFLDDSEKRDMLELDHDGLMEERSYEMDMDYDGYWDDINPGFLHEISEKIKENLR